MDQQSRARLAQLYRASLDRHGPTARGQRWTSEDSQRERFRLLDHVGPWTRLSVADVGCGAGDFLRYLRDRGWRGRVYDGFDIVPEMVEAARRKQRGRSGRFHVRDVLAEGFPRRYDYVVASGTFNLRIEDHERYFRRMVEAMYAACRRGVAFNVLKPAPADGDAAVDALHRNRNFGVAPAELLTLCHGFCPRVELLESERLRLETTVLLRRPA